MKLHEYQSKQIFVKYGIPIPKGEIAATPTEAKAIAARLGGKVVVKSQVLAGRYRRLSSMRIANTPDEAQVHAERILGITINGRVVQKVLVEEAADTKEEIYMAIMIDRAIRKPVLVVSMAGPVTTEVGTTRNQNGVIRLSIDPLLGLLDFQARNMTYELGLRREAIGAFVTVTKGLYRAFVENDASLVELNPLTVTPQGKLIAVSAKMDLDNDALFRHPHLVNQRDLREETALERKAREAGLVYVKLNGNIGCMVNGAGLAMATMDIVQHYGGKPANFLDLGDDAGAHKVAAALYINLVDPQVEAILCNIFGSTTRCDEVAKGILVALDLVSVQVPMVIRLVGINEEEGRKILATANFQSTRSFSEAAQQVVVMAKGEVAP